MKIANGKNFSAGTRPVKTVLIVIALAFLGIFCLLQSDIFKFFLLQAEGVAAAGTWEDDPKNWRRAFNEEPPAGVNVVHSKYWRSDHFTYEYIYYFEVEATPEWRANFLKQRQFELVAATNAWRFGESDLSDRNPGWFAPGPVEKYEVWDKPQYHGSVWIDKTNGHMFFYDSQL
jgi:hypothetical protein